MTESKKLRTEELEQKCRATMAMLCAEIDSRRVGSEGNRRATRFFKQTIERLGWQTEIQEFDAIDWEEEGASLRADERSFEVLPGPYSQGCDVRGKLGVAATVEELAGMDLGGKIVLLMGEVAKEQLMPKNFVFYNPEEHQRIIAALEKGKPLAVIGATGRNAALAGGVYPFPLIEDGDFDIPNVYMTEEEGAKLLPFAGSEAHLVSRSKRIPGTGWNVTARKGDEASGRIVVTAHIDAKKGTPGAIDNASGVTVLLLLAELLKAHHGSRMVELTAFNGEDYYAVPGQMLYIQNIGGRFDDIALNINIDGAGYHEGKSAFSFYGLPAEVEARAREVMTGFEGIVEGAQWVQGDHSIFVQNGRPAIAVTSDWFSENVDSQQITHTPKDNLDIIDYAKIVEIAQALAGFIEKESAA